jgi:DNA-binding LacI/PurR family transcriptional regulator
MSSRGPGLSSMRAPPTLKDVARLAECSTAVVSTVINSARGNTAVSAKLRSKVENAARELGYIPHFASRSLARRTTQTIGIYIPPGPWTGPGYSYEGKMLQGIERACRTTEHDLLLINLTGTTSPELCRIKFAQRRIDGLLLLHVLNNGSWIDDLLSANPNIVAVDHSAPHPGLGAVMFDNVRAGEMAVNHLVELGHRRIGFITSSAQPDTIDAALRADGYRKAMKAAGLAVDPAWFFDRAKFPRPLAEGDALCQLEGKLGADYFLALPAEQRPTAIIGWNDLVVVFALQQLKIRGVKVPADMSLVGFDNSEWANTPEMMLTSIEHPLAEMGERAALRVIAQAQAMVSVTAGSEGSSELPDIAAQEFFAPRLVVRDSTAAALNG